MSEGFRLHGHPFFPPRREGTPEPGSKRQQIDGLVVLGSGQGGSYDASQAAGAVDVDPVLAAGLIVAALGVVGINARISVHDDVEEGSRSKSRRLSVFSQAMKVGV